uniref:Endonuclease/exonuclease/phosphatase domain-containing protein n=1 Tax=Bactrocera latifrons TaxID=174628 RepID=A0A0K8UPJ4_BACLA
MAFLRSLLRIFARSPRRIHPTALIITYQNVRGLRTKLNRFLTSSSANNTDVFCITESWLHPAILDGEIIDSTYSIYRKDRNPSTSGCIRGGGVFIAIKRSFQSELVTTPDDSLEQVFIKVKCNTLDIIIGCVYLPPQSTHDIYNTHLHQISYLREKFKNAKLVVIVDYNLPSSSPRLDCENLLYEVYASLGCTQLNDILNEHQGLLDFCFSNLDVSIQNTQSITPLDKYHPALEVTINILHQLKPANIPSLSFRKADYVSLNTFFLTTNWSQLYSHESLDDKVNYLYKIIKDGISPHVPVYINKLSNYPCWFSTELIRKVRLKKAAHSIYKNKESSQNYKKFSQLRHECKELSASCYKNYVNKVEQLVKSDPNEFWKFVRNQRRNGCDIPSTLSWNNQSTNNGEEVSNLFAAFFKSVYQTEVQQPGFVQDFHHDRLHATLDNFEVTTDNVFRALSSLNPKKGAGPDDPQYFSQKLCSRTL